METLEVRLSTFPGRKQERVQKLKTAVGRIETENADVREKLRSAEQRATLLDESKARLEADLSAAKKAVSEKQMEIEVMEQIYVHSLLKMFNCDYTSILQCKNLINIVIIGVEHFFPFSMRGFVLPRKSTVAS